MEHPKVSAPVSHCIRHFEEPIAGQCRTCSQVFCSRCLVFAFGPKNPPYCVGCALSASGVRNTRNAPIVTGFEEAPIPDDKRVDRAQKRAARAAARAEAKAAKQRRKNGEADPLGLEPEPRPTYVPAPSTLTTKTAQQVVLAELAAEHAIFDEEQ